VRIIGIDLHTSEGPVIEVEGADLMDGTPIFDIKPYLPFTDSHPDALAGFTEVTSANQFSTIRFSEELLSAFDEEHIEALREILLSDPRPHYHDDAERIYAMEFAGKEVKFRVKEDAIEVWLECNKTE
jgi:hypothetical protein